MLSEPFSSVSAQTVLETYTYGVKGGAKRLKTPPLLTPHPHYCPTPRHALLPPPPLKRWTTPHAALGAPPPPFLATDEQPLAKNTRIYTILEFCSSFLQIFAI